MTAFLIAAFLTAFAQKPAAPDSPLVIETVEVKALGAGKGHQVTATVTLRRMAGAPAAASYSYYFLDPKHKVVIASISAHKPLAPGESVKVTCKPLNGPLFTAGRYTFKAEYTDENGTETKKDKTFSVP
jgi:hypothetical protein